MLNFTKRKQNWMHFKSFPFSQTHTETKEKRKKKYRNIRHDIKLICWTHLPSTVYVGVPENMHAKCFQTRRKTKKKKNSNFESL